MGDTYIRVAGQYWMHQLCDVSAPTWLDLLDTGRTVTPGGQSSGGGAEGHSVTWTMGGLNPDYTHPSLKKGNLVEVFDGTDRVAQAQIAEVDRETWQVKANGLNQLGAKYPAYEISGGVYLPNSVPNTVIDSQIGAGLPWKRIDPYFDRSSSVLDNDTLGLSAIEANIRYVDALLDRDCADSGVKWYIDRNRYLRTTTVAATPKWAFIPDSVLFATADTDYASAIFGFYATAISSGVISATAVSAAIDTASAAKFGMAGFVVDLTPLGQLTSTPADANTAARLVNSGARLAFTTKVQTDSQHLQTLGGVSACLGDFRINDVIRVYNVADTNGNKAEGLYMDVPINAVEHTPEDGTITVEPVNFSGRDFQSNISDAQPPESQYNT